HGWTPTPVASLLRTELASARPIERPHALLDPHRRPCTKVYQPHGSKALARVRANRARIRSVAAQRPQRDSNRCALKKRREFPSAKREHATAVVAAKRAGASRSSAPR